MAFLSEFDTVDIRDSVYGNGYVGPYHVDAASLPEKWVSLSSQEKPTEDLLGLIYIEIDKPILNLGDFDCYDTSYTSYPKSLVNHAFALNSGRQWVLPRDTTITWTAYYKALYGKRDSLEVTTVFLGKISEDE